MGRKRYDENSARYFLMVRGNHTEQNPDEGTRGRGDGVLL